MDKQIKDNIIRFNVIIKRITPLLKNHHKESDIEQLSKMMAAVSSDSVSAIVCGEFKRGKSSFINAFLGEELCPTDAGIATSVVSIIKYGKERKVTRLYGDINNLQSEEIPFDAIEKYAKGTSLEVDNTTMLLIELPSAKLESGLSLIDTPGVGGLDPRHLFLTLYVLPKANVTFFVVDAGEPLSSTELDFYKDKIVPYSKSCKIILNKSDLKTKEELEQIIADIKNKISQYCGIDKQSIDVIPVSSAHWNMYNKSKSEKMKTSSNCEAVNSTIENSVPEYKRIILEDIKQRVIDSLSNIKEMLSYQFSQLIEPDKDEQELFKNRLIELKRMKDNILNPSSEIRKKISHIIKNSQTKVVNELTKQSILFSTECLDSILKRPEAKGDNGGRWVLQQINLGLESLAAEVDLRIESGFNEVNELLGEEIQISEGGFTERINVDLTPAERSIADKACNMTRQALPGLGVAGLAAGVLSIFCGPLVYGLGGLAAAAAYVYKSSKDSNAANRVYELKSKLGPQITIAMNDLKTYVQQRYDEFNEALVESVERMTNEIVTEMQDVVDALKSIENDKKEVAKQIEIIEGQVQFVETHLKQTELLLTNPFEK
ncbi:dynamin family protein [Bacteroides thetaiotaomicron]|uniref:dynamin family protein n=1 Tax=Bacteroides thetaiotaomicron TaxID=818 RepID=UPI0018A91F86|nr:dynamin family protein [Bacteroides thetaiotaomicron]MDC2216128.1 dynamin family protein [Bacteroides thetaiotaomicron]